MKQLILLLCILNAPLLHGAAYSSKEQQRRDQIYNPEEQEIRIALRAAGLSPAEIDQIIKENKQAAPPTPIIPPVRAASSSSATTTIPDPHDREAFRKKMVENAKNKKFGQLGK